MWKYAFLKCMCWIYPITKTWNPEVTSPGEQGICLVKIYLIYQSKSNAVLNFICNFCITQEYLHVLKKTLNWIVEYWNANAL